MRLLSVRRSGQAGETESGVPGFAATVRLGLAAAVPVILLANLLALFTPHARGIEYLPALRYAILAPGCAIFTLAAACLYRTWVNGERFRRPRALLALSLTVAVAFFGTVVGLAMGAFGPALRAVLALLPAALFAAWMIPRWLERGRPSRVATVAVVLLGALEIFALVAALASERNLPSESPELAFELSRASFTGEHRFMMLSNGARVHYVDEGKGETLLFLHGNPAWSFQWRDLIRGLRDSYRCVALDYPGFGLSVAPAGFGFTPHEESLALEEFVSRLGLRDVTLVMQDWGGPIGLGMAGRRPELVKRVILGSTWAWPTRPDAPRGRFSALAGGPIGEFLQVNFDLFPRLAVQHGIVREVSPEIVEAYTLPFRPLRRRGLAIFYPGQITGAGAFFAEVESGLSSLVEKPALILWALQDAGFPREDLERFQRSFPRHRTIELPGANHFFFEDEPELMIREISAFMTAH